jgi:stage IV sporulation protein FB
MTTLVDCPESRRGEWNFHLFDVPVRVKLWFWISVVMISGEERLGFLLMWVAVCFASILLHEFGHVYAFRVFGEKAEVVLYGWGGMAVPRNGVQSHLARFLVSLAGPAAGFALAGLAMAAAFLSGSTIHFGFHMFLPTISAWPALAHYSEFSPRSLYWYTLLNDLLFVNFYWGMVNLLPVYPLDGGHAARAVFEQADPFSGRRKSLILSAAVAVAVALFGLAERNLYMIVMFAVLAVSSLQLLESVRPRVSHRPSYR